MKAMPAVEMDRATAALRGRGRCSCPVGALPGLPARIVLTGGPGGGKTAVLEVVRRHFCEHVVVLPEAAKPGAPTDWTNVRRIGDTTSEALAGAGLTGDVGQQTLSVHSAGGRALMYALKNGEQLKADHLVIQDALFESNSGRGAATYLKQHLPQATSGVGRITLVPSTGAGAAGLMKDLDEPSLTRTQVLTRELKAAGRAVEVVNVPTHDDAAKQLRPGAALRDGWVP